MGSINSYGGSGDKLSNPPLGGPGGWAEAVAAVLNDNDTTVDFRIAASADTLLTPEQVLAGANVTVDRDTTPGSVIIASTGGGTAVSRGEDITAHGASGSADAATNTAAILAARNAAGPNALVYFPPVADSYAVNVDELKPYNGQTWEGDMSPRYGWAGSEAGGSVLRASTGTGSIVNNNNNTWNGEATAASRGVTIRQLGLYGSDAAGESTVDGINMGAVAGPERGWTIERNKIMYCGVGIGGYIWASTVIQNHISRCGYGISPHRTADGGRSNDSMFLLNYVYFNAHHAFELGGSSQSALTTIMANRFERSGALITGDATYDPTADAPVADAAAAGVHLTDAHAITLLGNSTDANTGPGLFLNAAAESDVNNVTGKGNIWKRDGIGDNQGSSTTPGIHCINAYYTDLFDTVTWGKPNDTVEAGHAVPNRGVVFDGGNFWSRFDGPVELPTGTLTDTYGLVSIGTNWKSVMRSIRIDGYGEELEGWVGTSAEYAGLGSYDSNRTYYTTD